MTTTPQHQATALANPNIALVKYWGKRDEALILPWTGSLSLTLDAAPTTTTVRLSGATRAPRCSACTSDPSTPT